MLSILIKNSSVRYRQEPVKWCVFESHTKMITVPQLQVVVHSHVAVTQLSILCKYIPVAYVTVHRRKSEPPVGDRLSSGAPGREPFIVGNPRLESVIKPVSYHM